MFAIKLVAFMVSGAVIGVAGALLVFLLQGVYADNLGWQHSGDALLTTVLGGTHHFLGPLWGAIVFILLEDKLSAVTENWWLISGPILVAIALLAPEGLQGLFQRLLRRPGWTLVRPSIPARPTTILQLAAESPRAGTGVVMEIRGLSKRFGAVVTADRIDLDISRTGVHSLIGPNGAGKTTFFNLLAGALGMKGKIPLVCPTVSDLSLWEAGPQAASGTYGMPWCYNDPHNGPEDRAFTAAMVQKHGAPPPLSTWLTWTSMRLLLAGIKLAGSTDSAKIVEALESVRMDDGGMPAYFRASDRQLVRRCLVVRVKADVTDKWEYLDVLRQVPETAATLDGLYGTPGEIGCKMVTA